MAVPLLPNRLDFADGLSAKLNVVYVFLRIFEVIVADSNNGATVRIETNASRMFELLIFPLCTNAPIHPASPNEEIWSQRRRGGRYKRMRVPSNKSNKRFIRGYSHTVFHRQVS